MRGNAPEMRLERTLQTMGDLLRRAPRSVARVSGGGGLPIPYHAGEPTFPTARYVEAWCDAREAWRAELDRELAVEVEPGRYLVAQAGVLLTEVRARKRTEGYAYLLVDAGFHTLLRPTL